MTNYDIIRKWIGTPDYKYYKGYHRYLRNQSIKSLFDKSYVPLKEISFFRTSKYYDPYAGWSSGYVGYTDYLAEQVDRTIKLLDESNLIQRKVNV